jgi:hypothetical protein
VTIDDARRPWWSWLIGLFPLVVVLGAVVLRPDYLGQQGPPPNQDVMAVVLTTLGMFSNGLSRGNAALVASVLLFSLPGLVIGLAWPALYLVVLNILSVT